MTDPDRLPGPAEPGPSETGPAEPGPAETGPVQPGRREPRPGPGRPAAPAATAMAIGGWEVLAFGCELGLLAALAVAGWRLGRFAFPAAVAVAVVTAVALPALLAVVWGRWLAPTSSRRLTWPALDGVKVVLYVLGGAALAVVGHPLWGLLLTVISAVDLAVIRLRERARTPR
jgi:hypothetical protein